jgi:ubiquinol-cytochrome c reductase cytochrome c subunit
LRRLAAAGAALLVAAVAGLALFGGAGLAQGGGEPASPDLVARGQALYRSGCSSCHGFDARGIPGRAPSLRGVGALSADFYLRTGRMPLQAPQQPPERGEPAYSEGEIRALVAYVASFGGPRIPEVDPAAGKLPDGMRLFSDSCAGCHQIVGRGGIVTGSIVPSLEDATPTQIAEAMRIGPYLMPVFGSRQLDTREVDSIARYIVSTRHPVDRGGWGLGFIGPIPEGMVTWFVAIAALLVVARLIGERTTR